MNKLAPLHFQSSGNSPPTLSPICPRCQKVLDIWHSKEIAEAGSEREFSDPDVLAPRIVESSFLCLKFLGLYKVTPQCQRRYIEALRLDPQHDLSGAALKYRFYTRYNEYSIGMYHSYFQLTSKRKKEES